MKTPEELNAMRTQYRNDLSRTEGRIHQLRNLLAQAQETAVNLAARLSLLDELEPEVTVPAKAEPQAPPPPKKQREKGNASTPVPA